jgi:drug/metabolite transporter (DMT)-like permease
MLAAMNERSFVVSIAYIKTEPVQVALFGLVFLGDAVTIPVAAAILIATAGVVFMSVTPGQIAARAAIARRCSGSPRAPCLHFLPSAIAARSSASTRRAM